MIGRHLGTHALATFILLASVGTAFATATITVVNGDTPGEGFNDPTAVAPVGGNAGTTLGQQRLIGAQYAADIWGALLDSTIEIRVRLAFNPMTCTATSAVIGSTGPTTVHRNFVGALRPELFYTQALANKLAGIDLNAQEDIAGAFNSTIGTSCALPRAFYYGLDASPPGTDLDFVTIVLHEIAHGLGFISLVDLATGARLNDTDDAFSLALENHSACQLYPKMDDEQRLAASIDTGDLHWAGAIVTGASGALIDGVHPSGHVEMFAPNPALPGSSVSHFSNEVSPNELLEPSYIGPGHDVGLALDLLLDVGWSGSVSPVLGGDCPGGEDVINTFRSGDQDDPAIAVDGAGNYIVVWESHGINNPFLEDIPAQDGAFSGIFAQRFDSGGVRIGVEFQVNTITIGYDGSPDAVAADDGRFVVVWRGRDGDAIGQRFDSDGGPIGGEFLVNSYTVGPQGNRPKIAGDGAGNFVVVWHSNTQDGHQGGMFGQRFDSAGAAQGSEFQINTFTPNAQGDNGLGVAMAEDGTVFAVWKSSTQDSNEFSFGLAGGVFGQRFDSSGARIGGEFQVNTYTPGDQGTLGLDIDIDAAGNAVVVWQAINDGDKYPGTLPYGGIAGQRFDATGAPVGSEFIVNTLLRGLQIDSRVAFDSNGGFTVVWDDFKKWPPPDPPNNYILAEIDAMAQRFDSAGAKLGPQFRVNSYVPQSQRYPSVAADTDGGFIVVWASQTCSGNDENLCFESQDGMGIGILGQRYRIDPPACGPTPRTNCASPGRSSISIGTDRFGWKWRGDGPLDTGHFGQPAAGITHFALCVYQDGAGSNPVLSAAVPPGGSCSGKPCWKERTTGFQYKDSAGSADGITKIKLKAGAEGKSRLLIKGEGPALTVPLPLAPYTTLHVQLVNGNGDCIESTYSAPATRNTTSGFRDKD